VSTKQRTARSRMFTHTHTHAHPSPATWWGRQPSGLYSRDDCNALLRMVHYSFGSTCIADAHGTTAGDPPPPPFPPERTRMRTLPTAETVCVHANNPQHHRKAAHARGVRRWTNLLECLLLGERDGNGWGCNLPADVQAASENGENQLVCTQPPKPSQPTSTPRTR
jgi:hypothetical protein